MESRGLVAGLMLFLPLAVCGMISLAIRTPAPTPPKMLTDWPPFTTDYREEGHVHVIPHTEPGFQRYHFVFNTPTDWKHTITDSTQKAFIGSYKQYTGVSLIEFDASSNSQQLRTPPKLTLTFPINGFRLVISRVYNKCPMSPKRKRLILRSAS